MAGRNYEDEKNCALSTSTTVSLQMRHSLRRHQARLRCYDPGVLQPSRALSESPSAQGP